MRKITVVSVWNPKGGQGKSMFSINLAAAARLKLSYNPLVICQDPQGTAMKYYQAGHLPFKVIDYIPEEKPDADIVIIDHQASDWEVPSNDLILMPFKPARDQYATYIDAFKRAQQLGKTIITVVTDGQMHRLSEAAVIKNMKKEGAFIIPSSGVFSRAASEYRTIFDEKLDKAYKIGNRREDMYMILKAIIAEDHKLTNQRKEELEYA